jgi:hypothetical protein
MPTASGSIAYLGAARFQGFWNASTNNATGSGLPGSATGQFSTLLVNGGYHASTDLTASAGDYWQVTGSGTTTVDGQSLWSLNDWCIYSGSAGSSSGTWRKLAFEDTIASVIVGDLSASEVFNLTGSADKQILFVTGASDSEVVMSGSNNFTFDYNINKAFLTGTMHVAGNVSGSGRGIFTDELRTVGPLNVSGNANIDGAATFGSRVSVGTQLIIPDNVDIDIGTHSDASIFYDEANVDKLIISGAAGGFDIDLPDNVANAFSITEEANPYITVITTNSSEAILLSQNTWIVDDKKLYFGTNQDSSIEYNEDGDNFLIISGSSAGVALSGSTVSINGSLLLSVSTLGAPSTSQDSFYILDATDGAVKTTTIDATLGEIVADDGGLTRANSQLLISGSNIANGTIAVGNDQIVFLDADGSLKRETIADLATAMAGTGLNASSGQLGLHFAEIGGVTPVQSTDSIMILDNGSSTKRVTVTTMGNYLAATNGGLANTSGQLSISGSNLADAAVAKTDEFIFLDADGSAKRDSISDLLAAVAGDGLDVASDQLKVNLSEVIASDGNNRLLTSDGDGTATAEANLTYDGTTFNVHDDLDITGSLSGQLSGSVEFKINMKHNNTGQFSDQSGNQFLYLVPTGVLRGPAINAVAGGNSGLGFATSGSSKARIFHDEEGGGFLVISGSAPNGTALSGNFVRIPEKLAIGEDNSATKASGILVVQAAAANTTNGLIATFRSDDSDYGRINIDNSTANGDTQFTFMSNGSSKWSFGNMGSNETLHMKSGFGSFTDSDPFILSNSGFEFNSPVTASQHVRIEDDKKLYLGNDNDAQIEYSEGVDNLLVISGSSKGMVLSGSNINIGGLENGFTSVTKVAGKVGVNDFDPKVTFSATSNYQMVTFENQLSDGEGGGERLIYSPGANDTLTAGQIYFLHTDGTWDQADSSAMSTGGTQLVAVAFAGSSQQIGVLLRGFIRIPSSEILNVPGSGAVDGLPVYISTTAGHFDFTPPSTSGEFVRPVGHAIDDDSGDVLVYFNPAPIGTGIP